MILVTFRIFENEWMYGETTNIERNLPAIPRAHDFVIIDGNRYEVVESATFDTDNNMIFVPCIPRPIELTR